jgi:hypothetical protein
MSGTIHPAAQRYIPEELKLELNRRENLKSHKTAASFC